MNDDEFENYSDDDMKVIQHRLHPLDCFPGSIEQEEVYQNKIELERKHVQFSATCDIWNICWEQYK